MAPTYFCSLFFLIFQMPMESWQGAGGNNKKAKCCGRCKFLVYWLLLKSRIACPSVLKRATFGRPRGCSWRWRWRWSWRCSCSRRWGTEKLLRVGSVLRRHKSTCRRQHHVPCARCNMQCCCFCCLHNSRCVLHVVNVKRGSNFGGVQVFHLSICASLRFICPLFVMPFIAAMLVVRCLDVVAIAVKCLFTLRLVALGSGVSTEKKLKTMLKLKTENWIPKIQNQANAPPFPLRRWEVVVATAHILIYGLPSAAGFFYVRYAIHIIMLDTVGWSNRFDI